MPRGSVVGYLEEYFRTIVPEVSRQADKARSEHIKTAVWLVGLASTLLALFVSNREKVPFVSSIQAEWMVGLLGFSVLAGVCQRILLLVGSSAEYTLRLGFHAWLHASQAAVDEAEPLSDEWSADEIVARLKQYYDLDYSFFLKVPTALKELREAYAEHHALAEKFDQQRLQNLMAELGTWAGWSDKELRQYTEAITSPESARKPHIHYRILYSLGNAALIAGSASFCAAVVVLCAAFLS